MTKQNKEKRDPLNNILPLEYTEEESNNYKNKDEQQHKISEKITEKENNKSAKVTEQARRYTISMYPSIINRIKDYCSRNVTMNQSRLVQEAVIKYLDEMEGGKDK
ncbi:MAG: hypothetical protein ACOCRO_11635 [Halanaerobiales bacterium]